MTTLALPTLRPSSWWRGIRLRRSTLAIVGCLVIWCVALGILTQVRAPRVAADLALGTPAVVAATIWLRRMRFDWGTIFVMFAAMVLWGFYMGYTAFGERNLDGGEQLAYVRHIAKTGSLPADDQCFVCHHPPAYYAAAAAVYRTSEAIGGLQPVRAAQGLSLPLAFAFVVFGALTIRRLVKGQRWLVTLGAALLALWPYTVINAARLHNDVLLATAMAGGLYFTLRWYQDDEARDLWLAVAFALLSVFTKSNGLVMVATLGGVAAYRVIRPTGRSARRTLGQVLPAVVVAVAIAGVHASSRGAPDDDGVSRTLGSAADAHPNEWVGNEPFNYLYFDVESFLAEPYVLARRDGSGRQYFWNHLLKSSLFSTHNDHPDVETSYRTNQRIASLMNAMLLVMVFAVVGGLLLSSPRRRGPWIVPAAFTVLMLGAHVAFKATVPFSHHNDFRLSYPVLIPFVAALLVALEKLEARRWLAGRALRLLAWGFVGLSAIYFVPKYDFVVAHVPKKAIRIHEKKVAKEKKPDHKWYARDNVILQGDELLEVPVGARDVVEVVLSTHTDDRVDLELRGKEEVRVIPISSTEKGDGLAIHRLSVDPPVVAVDRVRVIPRGGDPRFAVGHLLVHDAKRASAYASRPAPKLSRGSKPDVPKR